MKNAPFSFRYFSFLFSGQNCFFAYVQFEVFLPLLLSMLFGPKKGKVVLVVIFAVVFGSVRVNLVAGVLLILLNPPFLSAQPVQVSGPKTLPAVVDMVDTVNLTDRY